MNPEREEIFAQIEMWKAYHGFSKYRYGKFDGKFVKDIDYEKLDAKNLVRFFSHIVYCSYQQM